MSSADRWKALHDRIRAKERASDNTQRDVIPDVPPQWSASELRIHKVDGGSLITGSVVAASTGVGVEVDVGSGVSQPLIPLTELDLGGGVWDYLFPDEKQHPTSEAHVKSTSTCKGKYRIRAKGAACHGRACCEGA